MSDNRDVPDKKGRTGASRGGRPRGVLSRASLKQNKLKNILLKHMEPYAVEAIETSVAIMKDKDASATVRLQASKFLIERIGALITEAYAKEKDQANDPVDDEEQESAAVLSFTVIDNKK